MMDQSISATDGGQVRPPVSFRLREDIQKRFLRVVQVSKRSKTSIIEECLEGHLPAMEKHYLAKRQHAKAA